jgi:SAM-dependent methyltransferase
MGNRWLEIWGKKQVDSSIQADENIKNLFLSMKVADGYGTFGKLEIPFENFYRQFQSTVFSLTNHNGKVFPVQSVYEVGCGCGPNLLLLRQQGYRFGGCDYSETLINDARRFLGDENDLQVCEASKMSPLPQYDSAFSQGVFCYFDSLEYAETVLDHMVEKAKYSLGVLIIHDSEKENEYLSFRRSKDKNYDQNYVGLEKLFMPKQFFYDYAERRDLDITIIPGNQLEGYWNADFCYDVYMYKKV